MIQDAFYPLGRYGVYFDRRVVDAQSLLKRIQKALPFLKNQFETTVQCGMARRPIKVRIIGRVKEGAPEKLVHHYNQFRATLRPDQLVSKRIRELHCHFILFARDPLNAFDVFEELIEEGSTLTADQFMNEGFDLTVGQTNTAKPTEQDFKAERILDTLISCERLIARLKKEIQVQALELYHETKKLTETFPKNQKKVKQTLSKLQNLLVEENFEVKKRPFPHAPAIQFHSSVYAHEIVRIERMPKKSRHQQSRHLSQAKECLKRKAYDEAFEIFQALRPQRKSKTS